MTYTTIWQRLRSTTSRREHMLSICPSILIVDMQSNCFRGKSIVRGWRSWVRGLWQPTWTRKNCSRWSRAWWPRKAWRKSDSQMLSFLQAATWSSFWPHWTKITWLLWKTRSSLRHRIPKSQDFTLKLFFCSYSSLLSQLVFLISDIRHACFSETAIFCKFRLVRRRTKHPANKTGKKWQSAKRWSYRRGSRSWRRGKASSKRNVRF